MCIYTTKCSWVIMPPPQVKAVKKLMEDKVIKMGTGEHSNVKYRVQRVAKGKYAWRRVPGQTSTPKATPKAKTVRKPRGCYKRKITAWNVFQKEIFEQVYEEHKNMTTPQLIAKARLVVKEGATPAEHRRMAMIKLAGMELKNSKEVFTSKDVRDKMDKKAEKINAYRVLCSQKKNRKAGYAYDPESKRRKKIENLSAYDAFRLGVFKRFNKNDNKQWLYGVDTEGHIHYLGTKAKKIPKDIENVKWSTKRPTEMQNCMVVEKMVKGKKALVQSCKKPKKPKRRAGRGAGVKLGDGVYVQRRRRRRSQKKEVTKAKAKKRTLVKDKDLPKIVNKALQRYAEERKRKRS